MPRTRSGITLPDEDWGKRRLCLVRTDGLAKHYNPQRWVLFVRKAKKAASHSRHGNAMSVANHQSYGSPQAVMSLSFKFDCDSTTTIVMSMAEIIKRPEAPNRSADL